MNKSVKVGIIGGTGMCDVNILKNQKENFVKTKFGKPSDAIIEGEIEGLPCAVIARHGRDHSILPHEVNYQANIWALKEVGCSHVLVTTACGGLQFHTRPGDFLIPDQTIDRTYGRKHTFYGQGPDMLPGVMHVPMSEPFCEETRQILIRAGQNVMRNVHGYGACRTPVCSHPCLHTRGSLLVINGPRFSTRLESQMNHQAGIDLVNMSLFPEAPLAREAGLSYAAIAMVTDYDAWKIDAPEVSVEGVLGIFRQHAPKLKEILVEAVKLIGATDWTTTLKKNMDLLHLSRQDLLHMS